MTMDAPAPQLDLQPGQPFLISGKEFLVDGRRGKQVFFKPRFGSEADFRGHDDRVLAQMFSRGEIIAVPQALQTLTAEQILATSRKALDAYTQTERDKVMRRHGYIAAYRKAPHGRKLAACAELAKKNGEKMPSERTIQVWIRKFEEGGNNMIALLPKKAEGIVRKPILHPLVLQAMDRITDERYLTRDRLSMKAVYGFLLSAIAQLRLENSAIAHGLIAPSLSTFCRAIAARDPWVVMERRYGRRYAERHFKIKRLGMRATRPLERVFCDSKVVDVFCIDDRVRVRERFTLTVVMDAFSRMVVGFYLGPEKPSWFTVMEACRNAMAPKDYVDVSYKLATPWPCYGRFDTLVVDQGSENNNNHLPFLLGALGADAEFNKGGYPEGKGIIERFFRTISVLFHSLPASTRTGPKDRQVSEYGRKTAVEEAKTAGITISALQDLVHRWLIDVYHNGEHRELGMSPLQKWTEGCREHPVRPPPSDDELAILLGKTLQCKLQHYGINLAGLVYRSPELSLLRPKSDKESSALVTVKYDPGDISRIWVKDEVHHAWITAYADDQEYTRHLTESQHKIIRKQAREHYRTGRPTADQLRQTHAGLLEKFLQAKPGKNKVLREKSMEPTPRMGFGRRPEGLVHKNAPSSPLFEAQNLNGSWEDDVSAVEQMANPVDAGDDRGAAADRESKSPGLNRATHKPAKRDSSSAAVTAKAASPASPPASSFDIHELAKSMGVQRRR